MTFLLLKASTRHHVVAVFLFVRSVSLVPTGMDVYIVVSLVLFFFLFFYNLVVVVIVVVVDRNVLASSFCLDPSLLGFPRDGGDSLLVYHRCSRRILDFFEKRFSFLLRGSVSQFSDQRVSISCDDVSSQWDGGAASLILIFLASTLGGIFC